MSILQTVLFDSNNVMYPSSLSAGVITASLFYGTSSYASGSGQSLFSTSSLTSSYLTTTNNYAVNQLTASNIETTGLSTFGSSTPVLISSAGILTINNLNQFALSVLGGENVSGNITFGGTASGSKVQTGTAIILSLTSSFITSSFSGNLTGTSSYSNTASYILNIQSGYSSVSNTTSSIISFNRSMASSTYVIHLLSSGSQPLSGSYVYGLTLNGFTSSFSLYSGIIMWSAIVNTQ